MPGRDDAVTRSSPLEDMTSANAPRLRLPGRSPPAYRAATRGRRWWRRPRHVRRDSLPNVVYAFDLTEDGYRLRWKYPPRVSQLAVGIGMPRPAEPRCLLRRRTTRLQSARRSYRRAGRGHRTEALEDQGGRRGCRRDHADGAPGGRPRHYGVAVARRRRGLGQGIGPGVHRAVVWTGYTAGSDEEMPRTRDLQAVLPERHRPPVESWPRDGWRNGGAPVWGWLSYDPELDLVYYGTGNPAPYNAERRPGDNRWTTSVLARRPADGSLRWAYQFTPADNWDYDSTQEMILTELAIEGRKRPRPLRQERIRLHPGSRHRRAAQRRDVRARQLGAAGRPEERAARGRLDQAHRGLARQRHRDFCPALEGGKNQQPAAYSSPPRACSMSPPTTCAWTTQHADVDYVAGTPSSVSPYHTSPGRAATSARSSRGTRRRAKTWR